ncbi:hypothetical protein HIM_11115 [Hirsutella minnesotensis 3608]|uniref:EKC/KEOPS complex subunit BUD32 n=1 Tax=Hirsutella minnesotensis 3608 TaxID=1043627 RepID=A0A0F7ZRF0_9HYPO|nr:hypothetical protein HIM_11115 [Hirsutella minnesotensis 3608]
MEELRRRLREAEERAEREQQRAEREQQRAEREQQRAEREQQRAEREQQRAEREQQRAEREQQRAEREQQRAEREQQRAEREQQRAEREQQRAEEAEQERQEERDRAEREQQRAEREQQRAEEAEQERQEERDRAEREQQRAEREQQRAEEAEQERQEERDRAEREQQRAEREQQRAEAAEDQTRQTTFDEYIDACHRLVFSRLTVQQDSRLTSRGSITNPRDKLCPTILAPWSGFLEKQKGVFDTIYDRLPEDLPLFESRNFLAALGSRVAQRPIADERTLEYFMHNSVEDPVKHILEELRQIDRMREAFDMGNGIIFENHLHAISDVAEDVVARDRPSTPPQTPDYRRDLHRLRPDQICIYRSCDDSSLRGRKMIYVSEYKAPHKLTTSHFRAGLRSMDIYKEVVHRKTMPPTDDSEGRFKYHAERLTASAITQTYHYMIEGGLEYGLLTTGQATVFLKVDWTNPETLYFHLAEPGPEVDDHPEHVQSSTAVGQYLAFSLMALARSGGTTDHGQDERDRAAANLNRWREDFETTLRSIPESERTGLDSASSWAPTTHKNFNRSPKKRIRKGRPSTRGDMHEKFETIRDATDSSDDESRFRAPGTPTPSGRRGRSGQGDPAADNADGPRRSQRILAHRQRSGASKETEMQYCTQRCLLGLVRGHGLDPRCPNFRDHGGTSGCTPTQHPVNHFTWLKLLREQMGRTLDSGITKLGQHGARGVLFKVRLLSHGYTFVCKGTVQAFIRDLEHEAAVYRRLERIQGVHVPVFLGAVDLRPLKRTYYYDHRVYIVHMTCLSWGGNMIDDINVGDGRRRILETEAVASLRAMHQEGVVHKDVRSANMLFNEETGGVMMIDFERACLLEQLRRPLVQLVPNKRRLQATSTTDARKGIADKRRGSRIGGFAEDMLMARTAFLDKMDGRE